jgi:hypothetical protein
VEEVEPGEADTSHYNIDIWRVDVRIRRMGVV